MNKLYFASALLAAGYTAGNLAPVTSADARAEHRRVHVVSELAADLPALAAVKSKIEALQCATAESQESLPTGSCALTSGSNTCFYWGDATTPTRIDSGFLFGAQLVWDPTQR